jgi:outer membrane protein OmpA-like peptidoglycan-associated protein
VKTVKNSELSHRCLLVATSAVALLLVVTFTVVQIRRGGEAGAEPQSDTRPMAHQGDRRLAADAQERLDPLHAALADRGSVFRFGDVLFASGRADLQPGAIGSLNRLVNFLTRFPDRNVTIHGYTDSVGAEEGKEGLSERRADSVRSYLIAEGIGATRLFASGMGQRRSDAGTGSGGGGQQNRRAEMIVSSPPVALSPRARVALLMFLQTASDARGQTLP